MREAWKIAIACFVGGFICYVVATLFAPQYAWLGVFSGFAGGYLAYEFREVLKAIPIAIRQAKKFMGSMFVVGYDLLACFCISAPAALERLIFTPRPICYAAVIPAAFIMRYLILPFEYAPWQSVRVATLLDTLLETVVGIFMLSTIIYSILLNIAFVGMTSEEREKHDDVFATKTYSAFARWLGTGIFRIVRFCVWDLWMKVGKGIVIAVGFCAVFVWMLFKLIHSHKRVLCAIDGTIGGVVSFLCFYSQSASVAEHLILAAFGGLIGAAWGVLNWEIISIRLLKVNTTSTSA